MPTQRAWRTVPVRAAWEQGAYSVRLAPWIIVSCILTAWTSGCSSLAKKNSGGDPAAPAPGAPPAKFPGAGDPILNSTSGSPPGQAIIAGRVEDEYGRPAPNTYIRVVAVTESDAGSPLDIAATSEGYFTIQGLKEGVVYKLIARTKAGEKMIAGQTQTSAPNVRGVVIKMRGDLVGATTPDLPAHVGEQTGRPATSTLGTPQPLPTWAPGPGNTASTPRHSVEQDLPPVKVPAPRTEPAPSVPPGIVDRGGESPPTLSIPSPAPRPEAKPLIPAITPAITPGPNPGKGTTLGPARVPSCVLIGKQLINFALNDINGEAWEFRGDRQGKLVLLDFWGTACIPCRETLPYLRELDAKYRAQGLEIIGLAYEAAGTPREQAYRVGAVMKGQNISYRQLLGAGGSCPVRNQFGVRFIPTLVLLDENGWILWRHEGRPDRPSLDELERWIQRRLPAKGR